MPIWNGFENEHITPFGQLFERDNERVHCLVEKNQITYEHLV